MVVGNHERLTRDTGWQPTIPLERTLDDLLAFWRETVERDERSDRTVGSCLTRAPSQRHHQRIKGETSAYRATSTMAARSAPLFPLELHPTTRDVARMVKDGGADALTEAQRRADDARYQEVRCRSALNPVEGMPFRWTLNPYRGCTHGCHYCFARRYHEQFELGAGDEFATVILVKTNLPEVLRRELARPAWAREQVAVGTATDPYQPIEGHYKLTRQSLEALCAARTPVGLVTKGPMVVRDADLFTAIAAVASCTVYVSVPSVNEDAWRRLEPGTASPWQRLKAVRALADAGVHVGVLMAPLVPGITADRDVDRNDDPCRRRPRRTLRRCERALPARRHAHALPASFSGASTRSSPRHTTSSTRADRNTPAVITRPRCRAWFAPSGRATA